MTFEDERAHGQFVIYHIVRAADEIGDPYSPPSLASEGFIHCSYAEAVRESAALYFPTGAALEVLAIDPLGLSIEIADTPRGNMPHVRQPIPRSHVKSRVPLEVFGIEPQVVDFAITQAMDGPNADLSKYPGAAEYAALPETLRQSLAVFCAKTWKDYSMAVYGADPDNPRTQDEFDRLKRDYSWVSEDKFTTMWNRAFVTAMM